VKKTSLAYL